jgi:hypothetical protein
MYGGSVPRPRNPLGAKLDQHEPDGIRKLMCEDE